MSGRHMVVLFGAMGRHNFGDILMAHVATALLVRAKVKQNVIAYSDIAAADMQYAGGHCVINITELMHCSSLVHVVHVGGATLNCPMRDARSFIGTEGVGTDAEDPAYVLSKASFLSSGVFVANAISGANAYLYPVTTALAMERLLSFEHVALRDAEAHKYVTRALHVGRHTSLPLLVPDSVAAVRWLFGRRIEAAVTEVRSVRRLVEQYPKGYVAAQLSAAMWNFLSHQDDLGFSAVNAMLHATRKASGLPIVLFRAGAAQGHDRLDLYERIVNRSASKQVVIFKDLDVWSICGLIAQARLVLASSLHARIVATAFERPRVSVNGIDSKVHDYLTTWEPTTTAESFVDLRHHVHASAWLEHRVSAAVAWALSSRAAQNSTLLAEQYLDSSTHWLGRLHAALDDQQLSTATTARRRLMGFS